MIVGTLIVVGVRKLARNYLIKKYAQFILCWTRKKDFPWLLEQVKLRFYKRLPHTEVNLDQGVK